MRRKNSTLKKGSKRLFAIGLLAGALAAALALVGCGSSGGSTSSATSSGSTEQTQVVKVAAVPTPHAEILNEVVAPAMKEKGYDLEVVEFNDYVLPNNATENGEVDANYFQHEPYLEDFNEQNGTHLVGVTAVHYEPFGIYAGKSSDLSNIQDGAVIAVPNDTTNEARALLLLQQEGLITLSDDAGINATKLDIVDNPKNLDIQEVEAAQIPRTLSDVDFAIINANYAIEAGLSPATDALAVEDASGDAAQTYANLLVVKEGNEDSEAIKALAEILNSDDVRTYIEETYNGAVLPISQ